MKSSQSRYARKREGSSAADAKRKPLEKNEWEDMTISEANMTAAIAQFMVQMSLVPKTVDVERVIVGDLANGFYPLAVLTTKGKTN